MSIFEKIKSKFSKNKTTKDSSENDLSEENDIEDLDSIIDESEEFENYESNNTKLKFEFVKNKKLIFIGIGAITTSLVLFMFSDYIMNFIYGEDIKAASPKIEIVNTKPNPPKKVVTKDNNIISIPNNQTKENVNITKVVKKTNETASKEQKNNIVISNIIDTKKIDTIDTKKIDTIDTIKKDTKNIKTISDIEQIRDVMNKKEDSVFNKVSNITVSLDQNKEVDPFLQQFNSTIENNKVTEDLKTSIKLMEQASDFLRAKNLFDTQLNNYKKNINKEKNQKDLIDVKREINNELEKLKISLQTMKVQNKILETKLDDAKNQVKNELVQKEKDKIYNLQSKDGLIELDNELILDQNYNGVTYAQNVYKIGSKYILEESSNDGSLNVYKNGSAYRGGIILDISPEILKLKKGNSIKIISLTNAMTAMSDFTYNPIIIPLSQNGEVTNKDSVDNKKTTNVKDYGKELQNRDEKQKAELQRSTKDIFSR